MPNIPNYTGIGIPGYDDMIGDLSEGQSLLGSLTSGEDISRYFGFNPEDYGQFFNPINASAIDEGLSQIPELQSFLYGQARSEYGHNRNKLESQLGRSNLSGSGYFGDEYDKIGEQFSGKMFSADKQIQDLIQQYQNQLNEQIGSLYGSAQNLLAGGAESKPNSFNLDDRSGGDDDRRRGRGSNG